MDNQPLVQHSFRNIIHDLNQVVFLVRGHCELAQLPDISPEKVKDHLKQIEHCLADFEILANALKQKQLELVPDE
jgi:hypothetical protein